MILRILSVMSVNIDHGECTGFARGFGEQEMVVQWVRWKTQLFLRSMPRVDYEEYDSAKDSFNPPLHLFPYSDIPFSTVKMACLKNSSVKDHDACINSQVVHLRGCNTHILRKVYHSMHSPGHHNLHSDFGNH